MAPKPPTEIRTTTQDSSLAAAATEAAAAADLPSQPRAVGSPLYRSAYGSGRTAVFSIKTPLPPGCEFAAMAARLQAVAAATMNARIAAAAAAAVGGPKPAGPPTPPLPQEQLQQQGQLCGSNDGSSRPAAADLSCEDRHKAAAPPPQPRQRDLCRLVSMACVEGCVKTLVVVHLIGPPPPPPPPSPAGGSGSGRGDIGDVIRSYLIQLGPTASTASYVAAYESALRNILHELQYDGGGGGGSGDDDQPHRVAAVVASGGGVHRAAGRVPSDVLMWPPVLCRLERPHVTDTSARPAAASPVAPAAAAASASVTAAPGSSRQRSRQEGPSEPPPSGRSASGYGNDSVLVLLPVRALPAGVLGTVRCVVVGPVGRWQQQHQEVYLDEEMEAEELFPAVVVENGQQQDSEGDDESGTAEYRVVRVRLPPAALVASGALSLHLLPPRATAADSSGLQPPDAASPSPPSNAITSAEAAAASVVVPDGAASPTPAPASSSSWALLATMPLLVLPAAAAEEVRQLYVRNVFGGGEPVLDALDQLLLSASAADGGPSRAAAAAGAGSRSGSTGFSSYYDSQLVMTALPRAAEAQHVSGLLSLAYDIDSVLDEQRGRIGEEPLPPQRHYPHHPHTDPRVISSVLSFLEEHGMTACLDECRGAMGHVAGPELLEGIQRQAATAAVTSSAPPVLGSRLEAAAAAGAPTAELAPASCAAAVDGGGGGGGDGSGGGGNGGRAPGGDEDNRSTAAGGLPQAPARTAAASSVEMGDEAASCAAGDAAAAKESCGDGRGGGGGGGSRSGGGALSLAATPAAAVSSGRGLLRSLLFGFSSPPGLEAAYQDFKAAQCGHLDRAALCVAAALRISSALRSVGGSGGGQLLSQMPYIFASVMSLLLSLSMASGNGR
ncbi:hypothetical protein PLESTB_001111200 [Pleodorina starrii]|uniref:Uncharacterized protein n=1 Tax=Pleodorina starrii TaxID=330485 RepID=A0A9W6F5G8_9CHLO|nr:hypothetical protein PLESTB_001111200 [Pleodorina starrii]